MAATEVKPIGGPVFHQRRVNGRTTFELCQSAGSPFHKMAPLMMDGRQQDDSPWQMDYVRKQIYTQLIIEYCSNTRSSVCKDEKTY